MKTRNGFVSNSSSSSFIIAVKVNNPCPHCHRKDDDFLDMISKAKDGRSSVNIAGYAEVKKSLLHTTVVDNPNILEELKKYYDKQKEWIVADVTLSDSDDDLHRELRKQIANETVIVLASDYGY